MCWKAVFEVSAHGGAATTTAAAPFDRAVTCSILEEFTECK